jgi:hypothetical protein
VKLATRECAVTRVCAVFCGRGEDELDPIASFLLL